MDKRGGKGKLGKKGQARFPLHWNRAWLPFALIPLDPFAISPRENSLVESPCLCVGQAQLHNHHK